MEKNKHLTIGDRKFIEDSLNHKMSYVGIAKALGKDPTTISKEVKTHSYSWRRGALNGRNYNNCKHQFECKKTAVCTSCGSPKRHTYCRNCINCNQHCPEFEPMVCLRRKKTAYVCNGCSFITNCNFEKKLYRASVAQQEYKLLLSEARSGIGFTEEELKELDKKVSPLILQGQSPHHISVHNRDSLMVSEATIYRLVDSGLIAARNLDLPRKVRYRVRKRKKSAFKVDRSCRVGRDYACFQRFMDEDPDTPVIQLDSVIGRKGGKVLLTIHFVNCEMMCLISCISLWGMTVSAAFSGYALRITEASFPIRRILNSHQMESGEPGYSTVIRRLPTRRAPQKGTTNLSVTLFPKVQIWVSILRRISP